MRVNWSEYKTIEQLENDIRTIKIQGATNVALAVVRGMEIVSETYDSTPEIFLKNILDIGNRLATTRVNEPLARNAVKYLEVNFKLKGISSTILEEMKRGVSLINSEYLNLVEKTKQEMTKHIADIGPVVNAFTHCHSSTVEKMLKILSEKEQNFKVACTETRPLYQGRITATNLVNMGINTTLIVDSAAASFVADRAFFPVDVAFIGADEITLSGDVINKVGSFGIAVGSYFSSTPLYVVASLLKVNPATAYKQVEIEMRDPFEVWENPPQGLSIYNPAFELVPSKLITGYITEVGIVKPEEIAGKLHETYGFVF